MGPSCIIIFRAIFTRISGILRFHPTNVKNEDYEEYVQHRGVGAQPSERLVIPASKNINTVSHAFLEESVSLLLQGFIARRGGLLRIIVTPEPGYRPLGGLLRPIKEIMKK